MNATHMRQSRDREGSRWVLAGIATFFAMTALVGCNSGQKEREEQEAASLDRDIAAIRRGEGHCISLYDRANTDLLLQKLRHLKGLRHLILDRTNVTDAGIACIGEMPDLRILDIKARIGDRGISALAGHANIEELYLWCPGITDTGVSTLKTLPKLKVLYLQYYDQSSSYLTDKALDDIAEIRTLEKLVIAGKWYTRQAVESLKKKRPDLRVISNKSEAAKEREREKREGTKAVGEKTPVKAGME